MAVKIISDYQYSLKSNSSIIIFTNVFVLSRLELSNGTQISGNLNFVFLLNFATSTFRKVEILHFPVFSLKNIMLSPETSFFLSCGFTSAFDVLALFDLLLYYCCAMTVLI